MKRMIMTRRAVLIGLPLFFTACSVGPDYVTPTAPTPAANYKEIGDWKPAQPKDDMIRGKWWEIYHAPQLNALEDQVTDIVRFEIDGAVSSENRRLKR